MLKLFYKNLILAHTELRAQGCLKQSTLYNKYKLFNDQMYDLVVGILIKVSLYNNEVFTIFIILLIFVELHRNCRIFEIIAIQRVKILVISPIPQYYKPPGSSSRTIQNT